VNDLWRLIEIDSRAVEACTGALCFAMALATLLGGGALLPWPVAAWVWLGISAAHVWSAASGLHSLRQAFAGVSVLTFAALALVNADQGGWVQPGVAVLVMAAIIQCWVWLAVEADRVDDKCRGKHVH